MKSGIKVFIQIPCLNEEKTLPETLRAIPRQIDGVDSVEILVINDGSRDRTVEVAREMGVRHVLSFNRNQGLARAFQAGIEYCLQHGADVIVNTDADNQYHGGDIPKLVHRVIRDGFDVVVGDRQVRTIAEFSPVKKFFQRLGSSVVRRVSGTGVPDATSGFRAFSREAAMKLYILSDFTYTLEHIIQAGKKRLRIGHVPIRTNPKTRESRLFSSMFAYIKRSAATILRIYTLYEPLKTFSRLGFVIALPGLALMGRFFYYYFFYHEAGKIQSLIVAAVFLILGFLVFMLGVLADLIGFTRKLQEESLYKLRKLEARLGPIAPDAERGGAVDGEGANRSATSGGGASQKPGSSRERGSLLPS